MLMGSNYKQYQYLIQNKGHTNNNPTQVDAFTSILNHQIKNIFNIHLNNDKEGFTKNLKFRYTNEFYLNSQLMLMEFRQDSKSLSDLLDEFMLTKGLDGDFSLECDLLDFLSNTGSLSSHFNKMDEMVPKNLIKNFVVKNTQTYDEYFLLRKNFITSFGLENFFSYIIANGIYSFRILRKLNFIRNVVRKHVF